jgi:hypothetical protein
MSDSVPEEEARNRVADAYLNCAHFVLGMHLFGKHGTELPPRALGRALAVMSHRVRDGKPVCPIDFDDYLGESTPEEIAIQQDGYRKMKGCVLRARES